MHAPPDLDHTLSLDQICFEHAYCCYNSPTNELLSSSQSSRRSLSSFAKSGFQSRKALRIEAAFSVSYHSFCYIASDSTAVWPVHVRLALGSICNVQEIFVVLADWLPLKLAAPNFYFCDRIIVQSNKSHR